jgi:hypothetical protein
VTVIAVAGVVLAGASAAYPQDNLANWRDQMLARLIKVEDHLAVLVRSVDAVRTQVTAADTKVTDVDTKVGEVAKKVDEVAAQTRAPQYMAPVPIRLSRSVGNMEPGWPTERCESGTRDPRNPRRCQVIADKFCAEMGHRRATNVYWRPDGTGGAGAQLEAFVCTSAPSL